MTQVPALIAALLVACTAVRAGFDGAWLDGWPLFVGAAIGITGRHRARSPDAAGGQQPSIPLALILIAVLLWLSYSFCGVVRSMTFLNDPASSSGCILLKPEVAFGLLLVTAFTEVAMNCPTWPRSPHGIGTHPRWLSEFFIAALVASAGLSLPLAAALCLRPGSESGDPRVLVLVAFLPAVLAPSAACIALRMLSVPRYALAFALVLALGIVSGLLLRKAHGPKVPALRAAHSELARSDPVQRMERAFFLELPQHAVHLFTTIPKPEESPAAYYFLGRALDDRGDHSGAARAFQKAAQLVPEIADVHYRLALSHERQASISEARNALRECLLRLPNHYPALQMAARPEFEIPEAVEALRVWTPAVELRGLFDREFTLVGYSVTLVHEGPRRVAAFSEEGYDILPARSLLRLRLLWICERHSDRGFTTCLKLGQSPGPPARPHFILSDAHPFSGPRGLIGEAATQEFTFENSDIPAERNVSLSVVGSSERLTQPLTIRSAALSEPALQLPLGEVSIQEVPR
ncbi:MAG: hypothetical protein HYU36_20375 [Planctomycetes bacterium]|nr:hypothetical protein [Planctomycetota bacterium]